MSRNSVRIPVWVAALPWLIFGCALSQSKDHKTAPVGFITTPASYYSSAKARYLGAKYKDNLDHLAGLIARNPKTANLQFANNIASVGGIGFFTHSATETPDERYLEVILSAPDTFETKEDFNRKVLRMFASYGTELLSILTSDSAIYQDKDIAGYGLNFTWRIVTAGTNGLALERAVIYLPKENVRKLLNQDADQNQVLARATVFSAEEGGRMNLVSYRPEPARQETRMPIHERTLGNGQGESQEPQKSDATPESAAMISKAAPTTMSEAAQAKRGAATEEIPVPAQSPDINNRGAEQINQSTEPGTDKASTTEQSSTGQGDNQAALENPVPDLSSKPAGAQNDAVKTDKSVLAISEHDTSAQALPHEDAKASSIAGTETVESAPSNAANPQETHGDAFGLQSRPEDERDTKEEHNTVAVINPENAAPQLAAHNGTPAVETKAMPERVEPPIVMAPVSPESNGGLPETIKTGAKAAVSPDESQQQIALQTGTPARAEDPKPAVSRPVVKSLQGYVIQLGFYNAAEAQRWAEVMSRRGYATSVTEADGTGPVRLRLGNFPAREEAERQLASLKHEGLNGIVIQLPQAYRPQLSQPQEAVTVTGVQ